MVGRTEWFRRTSWKTSDQREFHARLGRSRSSFHKAQYLRIQAGHLEADADPPEIAAALELLEMLLRDFPEPSQLALAHTQRGRCFERLGQLERAIEAFQAALDAECQFPGIRGTAYLDYAEVVLRAGRGDLYEDALARLSERAHDEPFPFMQYRSGVAAAILCERLGRATEARSAATRALRAAAMTESPFRYHRRLGLVRGTDPEIQKELWRLAGQSA